jgi:hypothetical protein
MKSESLKTRTANELGALLRHWRDLRGKSQFDVAYDGVKALMPLSAEIVRETGVSNGRLSSLWN